MKRVMKAAAIPLLAGLLIAGCSTMPKPDRPDATLLIIERGMEMPASSPEKFLRVRINLEGAQESIPVSMSGRPLMFPELAPGRYETESLTLAYLTPPGWQARQPMPDETLPLDLAFEMKAGHITVFPVKMVQYAVETGTGIRFGFRVDPVDPASCLRELCWMDEFALWENDHNIAASR